MIKMIAKEPHDYDGKQRTAGERYDALPEHVVVITAMGWAETAEHFEQLPEPRRRASYKRILAS